MDKKTLAEYQEQPLNNGLTPDESRYLSAKNKSVPMKDCTLRDFKSVLLKGIVQHGIQLPSEEETALIYNSCQAYFAFNSLAELGLALELNSVSIHWKSVQPYYGVISVTFVSQVMQEYTEFTKKLNKSISAKLSLQRTDESRLLSAPEVTTDWKAMFQTDVDRYKKGSKDVAVLLGRKMLEKFYELGIVDDSWWSDADWVEMTRKAKQVVRWEWSRSWKQPTDSYKSAVIAERARMMYASLLSDSKKCETILSKLP